MKEVNTNPGKTYAVTSPNGCTVTQHVGEVDIVTDVPAGQQTLIIAHASRFEIDDDSAIVTECGGSAELVFTAATTRAASSGTGSDGMTAEERALLMGAAQRDADNTFSAGNTFTGAVDMSGAQVTPPEGWNVAELTPEAIQEVAPIAWGTFTENPTVKGDYSIAIGSGAKCLTNGIPIAVGKNSQSSWSSTAFGNYTEATSSHSTAIGYYSKSQGNLSIALGSKRAEALKDASITIGSNFTETTPDGDVTHPCTTQGTGSITIGAGANTLNNGDTESSNSVTIGCKASNTGADSVVIGASSQGVKKASVIVGASAKGIGEGESVAIGTSSVGSTRSVAVGQNSVAYSNCVSIGNKAKTTTTSTTVIGSFAEVTNTGDTPSTNTTVIGYGATASAPNAVVLGAGANAGTASEFAEKTVTIGAGAITLYREGIAIGYNAKSTSFYSIGLGGSTVASGNGAFALGFGAESKAVYSTAIGTYAKANDNGVVVFASFDNPSMTTKTQLYFSGANTPLANEYYNGEAMMGYTVTDSAGTVLACGTRRLSELFTDNTLTQPASLDENGEWVQPKVFHPSDLDLPVEEPTEPEDVEINIPEHEVEEYQPLPVYPIVEPEMEEI